MPVPIAASMASALIIALAFAGCNHPPTVGGSSQHPRRVDPITVDQAAQLLSPGYPNSRPETMYSSASPPDCRGLVLEVDSPFLAHDPVAAVSAILPNTVDQAHPQLVETAAVYYDDFSPKKAISEAVTTREHCRDTPITASTQAGGQSTFQLIGQPESGSPNIALWSLTAAGKSWYCNNALVAARNVAVEITSCYSTSSAGVKEAALSALRRIEQLSKP